MLSFLKFHLNLKNKPARSGFIFFIADLKNPDCKYKILSGISQPAVAPFF